MIRPTLLAAALLLQNYPNHILYTRSFMTVVRDTGAGLSAEQRAHLFEPFNRLGLERSTVEGHGVGLALAKRLVELQGGSIGVISAPGEGTTFWVALPKA